MVDFLLSVYDRVVSFFSTLWSYAWWTITTGYNFLSIYANYLHNTVYNYVYDLSGSLGEYKYNFRDKVYDLNFLNYYITKYVANDSYGDILDYRTSLKNPLSFLGRTVFQSLSWFTLNGIDATRHLVNMPVNSRNYMLDEAPNILKDYQINDKPSIEILKPRTSRIDHTHNDTDYPKLSSILDILYPAIVDVVQTEKQGIDLVYEHGEELAYLVRDTVFPRVRQLFETDYTGFYGLLDISQKLGWLASQDMLNKIGYLTNGKWEDLVNWLETPEQSLLDELDTTFIALFLGLLADWLLTRE